MNIDKKIPGNNIIININNHINNNILSNNNILNTTANNINKSPENNNKVKIILRNTNIKNFNHLNYINDKDILKKKSSLEDFEKNNIEKHEEFRLNDDKIFEMKQNCFYVSMNRLIYSEKCLNFYYINILIAITLFSLSIIKLCFVNNINSKKLNFFKKILFKRSFIHDYTDNSRFIVFYFNFRYIIEILC